MWFYLMLCCMLNVYTLLSFYFRAMAEANAVVPLSRLSRGLCSYHIVVKIDRIIFKEVLRYSAGPERPAKEQHAIQLVVFDQQVFYFFISSK